jgi:Rrf2 family protein
MVSIARHTDYATRLVLHLAALEQGALVPIAEIAARRLLPTAFVRRVVGTLAKAGIVETVRGAHGGVRLGRKASAISLLDIVRAMEGGVALNRCVETHEACPFTSTCPVHDAWTSATRSLERQLHATRLSTLAARLREPPAGRRAPVPRSLRPKSPRPERDGPPPANGA